MKQYLELMQEVLDKGHSKGDRTGTGTLSLFGHQMRFDLQEGFPLVTTKRCHLRSIIHELLWFLSGDTNTKYLNDNNVTIWDEWADDKGDLGPVYGKQWTEWNADKIVSVYDDKLKELLDANGYRSEDRAVPWDGEHYVLYVKVINQIETIIDQLKNDPDSRRIIVSAWNVGELDQMALAPCHAFFQFYSREMNFAERESWFFDNGDMDAFNKFTTNLNCQNLDREGWEGERYEYIVQNSPARVLSCQLYQRSADVFLGVPFNIASYALLIHMVAQQVNMAVGDFVWTGGDTHLYSNHLEQAKLQLTREPKELPRLVIKRKPDSIFDYKFEDFEIEGYEPHPPIKAPVAI